MDEMRGRSMLVPNGSPTFGAAEKGIIVVMVENLDLSRAINMLEQERADYYQYQSDTIKYHLKKHPNPKIKTHPCCSAEEPMYLGFSKFSPHYQRKDNPKYKNDLALAITNEPDQLMEDSVPYRLQKVLKHLNESGFITELEKKYYE